MSADGDQPAIRVRNVDKRFTGRRATIEALRGIDLDIATGEFVSLIGPSGCGKSTLLRLVGGLLAPDSGELVVEGDTPDACRRRKRFGLAPQSPALLPWRTVRQNVNLLNQVNKRAAGQAVLAGSDIESLLDEVGLGPFADAYPRELSGGMQQRVSLVRAFSLGAPILLMDEPFAALDEITRAEMRYLLLRLWNHSSATVLFVTHSIPEAVMLADRVVILAPRPGRVHKTVPVPLSRPRHIEQEDSPEFFSLVTHVRHALLDGMSA